MPLVRRLAVSPYNAHLGALLNYKFTDTVFNHNVVLPSNNTAIAASSASTIFGLYDALVTAYPSYITKSLAYVDSDNNNVYKYIFTPSKPTGKAILISGTHGEKTGVYTLYEAMNNICNSWKSDPVLGALRNNITYVVIPVVSVYSYNNVTQLNKNGVNIVYNFEKNWVSNAVSGPNALSEAESIGLNNILLANLDANVVVDHHNYGADNGFFLWEEYAEVDSAMIAGENISAMDTKWRTEYAFWGANKVGYTSCTNVFATFNEQANLKGIPICGILEVNNRIYQDVTGSENDSTVLTLAYEACINYLNRAFYYALVKDQAAAVIPSDSMLGKWEFNGDALDSSGNGNNWTVVGATLTADRNAQANKAYDFDGVNDTMSRNTIRIPDNKFAVCFWVKADAWAQHDHLFGAYVSSFNLGYSVSYNAGALRFWINNWNNVSADTAHLDIPITDTTQWHFVVAMYDKNIGAMFFSIDRAEYKITSIDYDIDASLANVANQNICKPEVGYFNGKIDKVYFYNRLLSDNEITAIYEDTV